MNTKKTETKTPAKDPKRSVEAIEIDHLENVVGGFGEDDGAAEVEAFPRRMVTDA